LTVIKKKKKVEKKEVKKENKDDDAMLKDLEMLADLKNQGIISQEEFDLKKKKKNLRIIKLF